MIRSLKGMIYTERFMFEPGELVIDGDIIRSVSLCEPTALTKEEQARFFLPGLIDIHFHGCAGYDFCDGTREAFAAIADYELRHGITSICPATMTFPEEKLAAICGTCAAFIKEDNEGTTVPFGEILKGIYLEGPFLSYEKRGAQNPAYIHAPDIGMLRRLQETAAGLIKVVAIAPETQGALECIAEGREEFRFSIAHTCADYDTAKKAIEQGAAQVTHLYNAMPPISHRAPGVVGAAADDDRVMAELICDGIHVHPAMVRNTFRLFGADRLILISDSMMAAGMPDGDYSLGGQAVKVQGNRALLADGTIAGSVTNLYDCMKTAISMGVKKEDAIRAATDSPARAIGIAEQYGSLAAGKKADILVVDKNMTLMSVIKGGEMISGR
jgi:N-acetylglucosamine-6-phosphate deacetylase